MICLRCGADNPAGMKFCGHCGAPLELACPSCGAGNPHEHRFCGQCGAPLSGPGLQDSVSPELYIPKPASSRSALPGEIKQVTVLFCDIVGSTILTERLGAEAMRDLVSSFLETSLAEVRRYGGSAPQFTGDGFMALFGAPVSQEDHVRRALLAAAGIQQALRGCAASADDLPAELPVRMGIHTGPVVFGPVSDSLRMDATAIGDTANIAARLQEAADPGTILLSEATRRLAQDYAHVELIGPLTLKGKDEPVVAYHLLGVSHRRSGLRETVAAHTTTFVDRESERAILYNFLRLVESGRSQAVGIVGEPGIGKSRLLVEFRRDLADGRVTWVEGRCASYGTAIPYGLLLDLLRSNCGMLESDTPEVITEKVRSALTELDLDAEQDSPVLLHLLGIGESGGSSALPNPEAVKAKAFEVFRHISIRASLRRTLVLVLEDLHWVDKTSEEFLGFLAENAADARILMLGTYRPGYRPPWIDRSYAGQAPLQPLSHDDSVQMVRSVLAERQIDPVTEEIVAKAEGNPFFLEQLALHTSEAKELRPDQMVPDSIHEVVMARIDRLSVETKQLLQTAAVIGREFPFRLLGAVCKRPDTLETQLRDLTRLEFIYERVAAEGRTYIFRHALTQETAYASLLDRDRRAHHGAVGHALKELYRDRAEEVAELLAFHFGRSGEAERAVDYAILAAEKAQRRSANNEALTYFDDALRRLDALSDTKPNRLRRIEAVLKRAEVQYLMGQYADNIKTLETIRDVVEQSGEPRHHATWNCWTGLLYGVTGSQPDMAIERCHQAARIAGAHGLQQIGALAASCLAQVYIIAGRLRDAIEAGEHGLAYFEGRGDHWWAARTLWFLAVASNYLGEWGTSINYCQRGIDQGAALGSPLSRSVQPQGWARMGLAYIQQGNIERGLQCCDEALALAPVLLRDAALAKVGRGYGQIKTGRFEEGFSELREALAWQNRSDFRFTYLSFALLLAEGYLRRGDTLSARELIQEVLDGSKARSYPQIEGRACWLMADSLAGADYAAAEGYIERAMQIFERVGARSDLAKAMLTQAALRQRVGDTKEARRFLERASVLFRELGTLDEPARVEAALAALDRGSPIPLLVGVA